MARHATPLPLLLGSALLLLAPTARSQDLVGCSLVDGQLSCVPGISSDPQAQIRALRGEIAGTLAAESAVQQDIDSLQNLVLAGETRQGGLLMATAAAGAIADLPPSAFHWYRLSPGASAWIWIEEASGPRYQLTAADVGAEVMVVVVQQNSTGVMREASAPLGPVLTGP